MRQPSSPSTHSLFFPNTLQLAPSVRGQAAEMLAETFTKNVTEALKIWAPTGKYPCFSVLELLANTHPGGLFKYTAKDLLDLLHSVGLYLPIGAPETPRALAKNLSKHKPDFLLRNSRARGKTVYHFLFPGEIPVYPTPSLTDKLPLREYLHAWASEFPSTYPGENTEKEFSCAELLAILSPTFPYLTIRTLGRELTKLRAFYPRLVPRKRQLKGLFRYTFRKPCL